MCLFYGFYVCIITNKKKVKTVLSAAIYVLCSSILLCLKTTSKRLATRYKLLCLVFPGKLTALIIPKRSKHYNTQRFYLNKVNFSCLNKKFPVFVKLFKKYYSVVGCYWIIGNGIIFSYKLDYIYSRNLKTKKIKN